MNICLFFEGTGQGVEGHITNVTRLRDLCAEDDRQRLHLESGPGTHFGSYVGGRFAGVGWQGIFRAARRWFEANYESLPQDGVATFVFLFGFSRGALLARHFAAWLDNHLIADFALAWIAAGAKREGLRMRRGVRLRQTLDASAVVLHDSHDEASNLWGAFDRVRRNLQRIRLHVACKGL